MKNASDFRKIARTALRGKWIAAALTGLAASVLGAGASVESKLNLNLDEDGIGGILSQMQMEEIWAMVRTAAGFAVTVMAIWAIVTIIIGGAAKMGYAVYNLKLVDGKEARTSDLFSRFDRIGKGFVMNFLIGLFTALWTLLFVIPGIVKQFSYAMTPYILAENPDMTANEAITESRRIMDGNKWRFFCLGFSFIGWNILCAAFVLIPMIVLGAIGSANGAALVIGCLPFCLIALVGGFFVKAYEEAAYAAFFRDISGYDFILEDSDENPAQAEI